MTDSQGPGRHHAEVGRIVISEDALQARIRELGEEITRDYAGRPPLLVGVLKGAFMFMSDLSRAIDLPVEFDFMAVSSYGSATRSSGVVRIIKDLDLDLTDRHVLIVEDIVDSGLTLDYLRKNLMARGPASMEVCAPPGEGGPAAGGAGSALHGLHHPAVVRHRVRPRRRRALAQPALPRRVRRKVAGSSGGVARYDPAEKGPSGSHYIGPAAAKEPESSP